MPTGTRRQGQLIPTEPRVSGPNLLMGGPSSPTQIPMSVLANGIPGAMFLSGTFC